MSEYQYYEFLAIDGFLSAEDMKRLRGMSRYAQITPRSFTNKHKWSGLGANPLDILARYFDVFLYYSNWGANRVAFRFPANAVDESLFVPFLVPYHIMLSAAEAFMILDISNDDEGLWDQDQVGWMAALAPARSELMSGDMRPLYIAWLMATQNGELDRDKREPPVPPGLGSLTPAQAQLTRFLRVDANLLAVAADASAELAQWNAALSAWIAALPASDKDRLLFDVATGAPGRAAASLIKQFRARAAPGAQIAPRRVQNLLDGAEAREEQREREHERLENEKRRRREAEVARKRADYLATLGKREAAVWEQVERLISLRKPAAYEKALALLCDLRDLAAQQGTRDQFADRMAGVQKRHQRKSSFQVRLRRAGLAR